MIHILRQLLNQDLKLFSYIRHAIAIRRAIFTMLIHTTCGDPLLTRCGMAFEPSFSVAKLRVSTSEIPRILITVLLLPEALKCCQLVIKRYCSCQNCFPFNYSPHNNTV